MNKVQHEAIESGFLDLLGEPKQEAVVLRDTTNTLIQLAAIYVDKIIDNIEKKDVASSGALSDSVSPTSVSINGTVYTIGIRAKDYASYQDQGVNGWAVNRGSIYSFKTKGVDPKGEMVKSIKKWLTREGNSARNVKFAISKRERRGKQIDEFTRRATSVAYMVKRSGVKATKFFTTATQEMEVYIENELGASLRIDIINNIL